MVSSLLYHVNPQLATPIRLFRTRIENIACMILKARTELMVEVNIHNSTGVLISGNSMIHYEQIIAFGNVKVPELTFTCVSTIEIFGHIGERIVFNSVTVRYRRRFQKLRYSFHRGRIRVHCCRR
ncbi:hypothetical protein M408DRAFT_173600 [Serendipita vermifera MAFF 305830]|uniref:Uncharacterized protein n=1 Tax=Serendipita vermifera MAFF 305830 TaxID=933852 RepID=A0A0C2WLD5_SERVB|nr:hypothetical protein M408DRAFT_146361 [Serendipita vermifera MAFF 305830]KIM27108.1 hypothetical protein M408DRAFT_173600 [Serendipita vermifera MAFF 305830]